MKVVDLDGNDPIDYGIEINMTGRVQLVNSMEGADYRWNKYEYPELIEDVKLFVCGTEVPLPKELQHQIEEIISTYLE